MDVSAPSPHIIVAGGDMVSLVERGADEHPQSYLRDAIASAAIAALVPPVLVATLPSWPENGNNRAAS
jgi:hypothetical protein